MPERYARRILDHLADSRYQPRTARELAGELGVPPAEREEFRAALDQLLADTQVVQGTSDTIALPPPGREVLGEFRKHERGFGFIVPDQLFEHGDLFVPPNATGDALTGDRVRAKVIHEKGRAGGGRSPYTGRVIEVLKRADRQYAGTLEQRGGEFFVQPDGRMLHHPVIIRDPHAKNARPGDKVVIDLVQYPGDDQPAEGVIVEVLGEAGEPDVETQAVMRAFGLKDKFPQAVHDQAREAALRFDEHAVPPDREDLTGVLTLTIDPPDAKDFDDAITLRRLEGEGDAVWELGIHIADVAFFIRPDTAIAAEAYERGNSTYLPRRVIPMLPEVLSNGVCSLQPGVNRFAKSCFIQYDAQGNPLRERFARTVIRSDKRLTYIEAQALIDDDLRKAMRHAPAAGRWAPAAGRRDDADTGSDRRPGKADGSRAGSDETSPAASGQRPAAPHYPREVIAQLKLMDELARTIRKRRLDHGMIVLGLPDVELVFDDSGRVVDAEPEDDSFTHTIIEMFMVEANEAAARVFHRLDIPMIRRVHPDPDAFDLGELRGFARVAGYNIPKQPTRKELQQLLDAVRGKPAQHAVHLAVLRTLSKAEYAPAEVGHFALASEHYTHFTSPIRRYPDLIVHRGLDAFIDAVAEGPSPGGPVHRHASPWNTQVPGKALKKVARAVRDDDRVPGLEELVEIGRHCSQTERNSESAERELRSYLVLELLSNQLGEDYDGVVTGVTGAGVFVQISRYLIDGFVKASDLPGPDKERWSLNRNTGALVAQRSGKTVQIGDRFTVRIAEVNLVKRQMELVVIDDRPGKPKKAKPKQDKSKKKRPPKSKTIRDEAGRKSKSGGGSGGGGEKNKHRKGKRRR